MRNQSETTKDVRSVAYVGGFGAGVSRGNIYLRRPVARPFY